MAERGAAVILKDDELDRLRATVDALVEDPGRRARMAEAARALAKPDAAKDIASEVLAAARRA
jgi:UDP-N-acetylglucosamine--N-acetylmuramyl-(pentapeptide) pyrophosphoryl-undecaprenol N-acetylglucosamine transferase